MEVENNKLELAGMKSQNSSNQNSLSTNEKAEVYLSLYEGGLDDIVITENIAKIKATFPQLPIQFYSILVDRIRDKGFSNQQLTDSVNNVIDNCIYPQPTIANFLSHDRKIRLFTYQEMLKKIHDSGGNSEVWKMHDKKTVNGVVYWFEKYMI